MRQTAAAILLAGTCLATVSEVSAGESCLFPPYAEATTAISALTQRLVMALEPFPSLRDALSAQSPTLCLSDDLVEEQGYFEPASNRIVLNAGLSQDFQLAILIHEVRHLDQFRRGACPTTAYRMTEYIRERLALEADASAVGVYVAWTLRKAGDPGPWEMLETWPTHDDLVARFAEAMETSGNEVDATASTFAQWYERAERREIYTYAICSNYLDALDREKVVAGQKKMPEDYAESLCVLPDGRPYDCTIPP